MSIVYRHGYGVVETNDYETPKCEKCGSELVRSSENYLACPNRDGKLVRKWNMDISENRVRKELRDFESHLSNTIGGEKLKLGQTHGQWCAELRKESIQLPKGIDSIVLERPERTAA